MATIEQRSDGFWLIPGDGEHTNKMLVVSEGPYESREEAEEVLPEFERVSRAAQHDGLSDPPQGNPKPSRTINER